MSGPAQMLLSVSSVPWVDITAAMWTQGDVASFTLGTGTVATTATDKTIITANSTVAASQDFDFRITMSACGTDNGPGMGFSPNGTNSGGNIPTTTDPVVFARNNSGAAAIGWLHDTFDVEGAVKAAGWMASNTIQVSRRGSTFYGLINGVVDRTYAETSGTNAGNLFIISFGGTTSWSMSSVQYRLGPGLPTI